MSGEATYQDYVGRQERREDTLDRRLLDGMAAVLDCRFEDISPDGSLPPLWHWMYFTPWVRQGEIGADGHPRRGGFMPPVELPRRMFAGARLKFQGKLLAGEKASRVATIQSVTPKSGAAGPMVFVTVRHEVSGQRGVAITEEQDIVYIGPNPPAKGPEAPPKSEPLPAGAWVREVTPDPVMLFRFSAMTANGHRIHYDHPYVTGTEGYPGLVVHGPLQAVLLIDHLRRNRPGKEVASFEFRARRPLFVPDPFSLVGEAKGDGFELTSRDRHGRVCMQASATLKGA